MYLKALANPNIWTVSEPQSDENSRGIPIKQEI
jgi:hypothetical protein